MPIPSRVVIVETIFHQAMDSQPTSIPLNFSRWLTSDDNPYQRKVQAKDIWILIEHGWLEDNVGMILVQNNTPNYIVQPSSKEREEAAKSVVEIGIVPVGLSDPIHIVPFCEVPRGEHTRWCPVANRKYYIRCMSGETRCTITLLPE